MVRNVMLSGALRQAQDKLRGVKNLSTMLLIKITWLPSPPASP